MGQVPHFLGIEFTWHNLPNGHLGVNLTQQSFTESLLESLGFPSSNVSTFTTPYRLGMSIDSIPTQEMSSADCDILRLQYQSLVGSLIWLAHTMCPDISTVFPYWHNIRVILLMVIWMPLYTLLRICHILPPWVFILAVLLILLWRLFFIFHYPLHFCLCLM
jgi:hypothetical protein